MKINKKEFVRARVNRSITSGEMLRTLRELQELSQIELGSMVNMSQSNISAMETDRTKVGRDRALVLAKALKVHPAVILFPDFDVTKVA